MSFDDDGARDLPFSFEGANRDSAATVLGWTGMRRGTSTIRQFSTKLRSTESLPSICLPVPSSRSSPLLNADDSVMRDVSAGIGRMNETAVEAWTGDSCLSRRTSHDAK